MNQIPFTSIYPNWLSVGYEIPDSTWIWLKRLPCWLKGYLWISAWGFQGSWEDNPQGMYMSGDLGCSKPAMHHMGLRISGVFCSALSGLSRSPPKGDFEASSNHWPRIRVILSPTNPAFLGLGKSPVGRFQPCWSLLVGPQERICATQQGLDQGAWWMMVNLENNMSL